MSLKEFWGRFAPSIAVVVSLAVLGVLVGFSGSDGDGDDVVASGPSAAGEGGDLSSAAVDSAADDAAAAAAAGAGTGTFSGTAPSPGGLAGPAARLGSGSTITSGGVTVEFGKGPNCRPDGRQNQIWLYAPVCVTPWPKGADNGGATARGVTRDKVTIVRFIPQVDPATQAVLRGLNAEDLPEDQRRIYDTLRMYQNAHAETYGREVVFVDVNASGPNDSDEAMKADAVKIANEIKALAVFGQTLPPVFAQELAQRGVPCTCVRSQSKGYYARNPPMIFGDLPTIEDYYETLAEYLGKRLANKPAKWAGDPTGLMQRSPRKFGLIYIEGEKSRADPDLKRAKEYYVRELAKYGVQLTADVGYLYDLQQAGEQSTNIIARMKAAGVSNLLFVGDPLTPIFVTQEATRQGYFPEWLISGTLLSDTTFFGRTYDKEQWRHAFGVSPLWVFFADVINSYGYRMYHHMRPGSAHGDEGVGINVYASPVQQVFNAIQQAGPRLTPDAFVDALLKTPAIGGRPAAPLVYFTRESPNAIKDFTEVFWDSQGSGKDETGRDGVGVLLKASMGKRYRPGEWPAVDPPVFDKSNAVFTTDNPPGGLDTYPHDRDGHRHDLRQRCMSC